MSIYSVFECHIALCHNRFCESTGRRFQQGQRGTVKTSRTFFDSSTGEGRQASSGQLAAIRRRARSEPRSSSW